MSLSYVFIDCANHSRDQRNQSEDYVLVDAHTGLFPCPVCHYMDKNACTVRLEEVTPDMARTIQSNISRCY